MRKIFRKKHMEDYHQKVMENHQPFLCETHGKSPARKRWPIFFGGRKMDEFCVFILSPQFQIILNICIFLTYDLSTMVWNKHLPLWAANLGPSDILCQESDSTCFRSPSSATIWWLSPWTLGWDQSAETNGRSIISTDFFWGAINEAWIYMGFWHLLY